MSDEFWAIVGAGVSIFFAVAVIGDKIEKRLDRIINLLFDIKIGRRD